MSMSDNDRDMDENCLVYNFMKATLLVVKIFLTVPAELIDNTQLRNDGTDFPLALFALILQTASITHFKIHENLVRQ